MTGTTDSSMKRILLLCGAVLMVAGCAEPHNPFGIATGVPYTFDLIPSPLPDLTPSEILEVVGAEPGRLTWEYGVTPVQTLTPAAYVQPR